MAKAPPKLTKAVTAANLERLGAPALARLLVQAAGADPLLRRRLRLELAAELGPAELGLELDRRMQTLGESRARISWRKRPELLRELDGLRGLIMERLAPESPDAALRRLIGWFDLAAPLSLRVKDPKGEVALAFDAATSDLARVAATADPSVAAILLIEAVQTRADPWAAFLGRAAPELSQRPAAAVMAGLTVQGAAPTGRRALLLRRLADRAGDLDAWLASFSEADRRRPEVEVERARRLARAGRVVEARAALDAAATHPVRKPWRAGASEPPTEFWRAAEIAVLEAEGRSAEAMEARWAQFERTLSPDVLRALIARLEDFEDVVAADRAVAFAQGYFDLMKGLAFLMAWGALREAADAIVARPAELRGAVEDAPLWASRLAARHPLAALHLLRARASALVQLGAGGSEESERIVSEAEGLAHAVTDEADVASHAEFVRALARKPNAFEARCRR